MFGERWLACCQQEDESADADVAVDHISESTGRQMVENEAADHHADGDTTDTI